MNNMQFKSSPWLMFYKWMRRVFTIGVIAGMGTAALFVWLTGSVHATWSIVPVGIIAALNTYSIFRSKNTRIDIHPEHNMMEIRQGPDCRKWPLSGHTFEPHIVSNRLNGAAVSYVRQIIIDNAYVETCHNMNGRDFDQLMALLQGLSATMAEENTDRSNETIGMFVFRPDRLIPRIRWRLLVLGGLLLASLIAPEIIKIYYSDPVSVLALNFISWMAASMLAIALIIIYSLVLRHRKHIPGQITVATRELVIDDRRLLLTDIACIKMPEPGNGGVLFSLRPMTISMNDGTRLVYTTGFADDDQQPESKAIFNHYAEFIAALGKACSHTPGKLILGLMEKES